MSSLKTIYVWRTLEFLTVWSIAYIFLSFKEQKNMIYNLSLIVVNLLEKCVSIGCFRTMV